MEFKDISARAKEIRAKYLEFEKKKFNQEWTTAQIAEGLVGDVGDLMKLVQAKQGIRDIPDVDKKLAHELSDCLWVLIILADKYGIDLEQSFCRTMDELDQRIAKDLQ